MRRSETLHLRTVRNGSFDILEIAALARQHRDFILIGAMLMVLGRRTVLAVEAAERWWTSRPRRPNAEAATPNEDALAVNAF